jgi:hypothetical protein
MLTQKVNIGFVIWGVRNGFEVMLASNQSEVEFLKSDVVSDNMRQVCNTTSETFYSIHRNQNFGVVTIYHSNAQDKFGRKAYVAISLYIPANYQFIGDVGAVLNYLKNYYIQKQANSYVNMFTAQMFTEQYSTLDCEKNNGFVIPGSNKGYLKFNNFNDIKERFRLLDINGYQSAFFIPSSVTGPENQLQGYQIINEFKDTIRIIVEGFDSSRHKIMYNNEPINNLETNFSLEVKPGNEITFIDLINNNRRQSYTKFTPDQVINLVALFPVLNNKPYDFESKDSLSFTTTQTEIKEKENKVGKTILVCSALISIIALVVFATLGEGWYRRGNDNESKPAAPNVGNEGNRKNNAGEGLSAKLSVELNVKVDSLYESPRLKLTDEDIKKIKQKLLMEVHVDSVVCKLPYNEVKIYYNSNIIKESDVVKALKSITVNGESTNQPNSRTNPQYIRKSPSPPIKTPPINYDQ